MHYKRSCCRDYYDSLGVGCLDFYRSSGHKQDVKCLRADNLISTNAIVSHLDADVADITTLTVSKLTAADLSLSGNIQLDSLTVTGDTKLAATEVDGRLTVTGRATIDQSLEVGGTTTLDGPTVIGKDAAPASLLVKGTITADDDIKTATNITAGEHLIADGQVIAKEGLATSELPKPDPGSIPVQNLQLTAFQAFSANAIQCAVELTAAVGPFKFEIPLGFDTAGVAGAIGSSSLLVDGNAGTETGMYVCCSVSIPNNTLYVTLFPETPAAQATATISLYITWIA